MHLVHFELYNVAKFLEYNTNIFLFTTFVYYFLQPTLVICMQIWLKKLEKIQNVSAINYSFRNAKSPQLTSRNHFHNIKILT